MKELFARWRATWDELDPPWVKTALPIVVVIGLIAIFYNHQRNEDLRRAAEEKKIERAREGGNANGAGAPGQPNVARDNRYRVLPGSNRNQGLENVQVEMGRLEERLRKLETGTSGVAPGAKPNTAAAGAGGNAAPAARVNLNDPAPVSFDQPKDARTDPPTGSQGRVSDGAPAAQPPMPPAKRKPKPRTWNAEAVEETPDSQKAPTKVIPINSALEAVMLSGMNALPSASALSGAVGQARSALNIGTPFVSRIKGDAILPNGWKVGDLNNCFLGGSGMAVLSAERTNVIAATMSCVDEDGVLWEGDVSAYGLDVDGTMGIACKVVNKQGSILMQAALTGMASGLGQALTPSAIPMYNQNATPGQSQGGTYPSASFVEHSMVGQGVTNATGQLSKFYLQFASQTLPVCESPAGTRITWILKKDIELKARKA